MPMDFFAAMDVSASGLGAERTRMNVAASNLANAQTTKSAGGGPYQRRDVVLESITEQSAQGNDAVRGVAVQQISQDNKPPRMEYDPGHPDANAQGYVAYPNINPVEEMVDMITASRAYEAGVTALSSAVTMAETAITIGK